MTEHVGGLTGPKDTETGRQWAEGGRAGRVRGGAGRPEGDGDGNLLSGGSTSLLGKDPGQDLVAHLVTQASDPSNNNNNCSSSSSSCRNSNDNDSNNQNKKSWDH